MNPANLACLTAAAIDCCVLANNHVLDWGSDGLLETLSVLEEAGLETAGAGRDGFEAEAPAALNIAGKGRVLVYGIAFPSSGVPIGWSAGADRPGVWLFKDLGAATLEAITRRIARNKPPGDVIVTSIHWGANWGYRIADDERRFSHRLIERAQVDIVHGHSSHHPKGAEIHGRRPVLYGCGDLINDYEGIGGKEIYRPDMVLIYLLSMAPDGTCSAFEMLPFRVCQMRLNRATREEAEWLQQRLDRESRPRGGRLVLDEHVTAGTQAWSLRLERG